MCGIKKSGAPQGGQSGQDGQEVVLRLVGLIAGGQPARRRLRNDNGKANITRLAGQAASPHSQESTRYGPASALCVYRSNIHIYAQIIDDVVGHTLVSASTVDRAEREHLPNEAGPQRKIQQAHAVGLLIAERALQAGINEVVFDRGGYIYHGRVRAVADGAREGGLKF